MKKQDTGLLLIICSIVFCVYSLFMDVSVKADTYGLLDKMYQDNPGFMRDRFVNNDLLNRRLCFIIISCGLFISGVILMSASSEEIVLVKHARAQTKILSLIVARQEEVDIDTLNEIIEEIEDNNLMFFQNNDIEEEETV